MGQQNPLFLAMSYNGGILKPFAHFPHTLKAAAATAAAKNGWQNPFHVLGLPKWKGNSSWNYANFQEKKLIFLWKKEINSIHCRSIKIYRSFPMCNGIHAQRFTCILSSTFEWKLEYESAHQTQIDCNSKQATQYESLWKIAECIFTCTNLYVRSNFRAFNTAYVHNRSIPLVSSDHLQRLSLWQYTYAFAEQKIGLQFQRAAEICFQN